MGSQSDWPTMREAASILDELGVPYEKIVSAHRTPDRLWEYGKTAADKGLQGLLLVLAALRICQDDGVKDPYSCAGRSYPDQGAFGC